jgi:hypothetical protein
LTPLIGSKDVSHFWRLTAPVKAREEVFFEYVEWLQEKYPEAWASGEMTKDPEFLGYLKEAYPDAWTKGEMTKDKGFLELLKQEYPEAWESEGTEDAGYLTHLKHLQEEYPEMWESEETEGGQDDGAVVATRKRQRPEILIPEVGKIHKP